MNLFSHNLLSKSPFLNIFISHFVLLRYEDPIMGPRKMPTTEKPFEGKVEIAKDDVFRIDAKANSARLEKGGDVGRTVLYWVG